MFLALCRHPVPDQTRPYQQASLPRFISSNPMIDIQHTLPIVRSHLIGPVNQCPPSIFYVTLYRIDLWCGQLQCRAVWWTGLRNVALRNAYLVVSCLFYLFTLPTFLAWLKVADKPTDWVSEWVSGWLTYVIFCPNLKQRRLMAKVDARALSWLKLSALPPPSFPAPSRCSLILHIHAPVRTSYVHRRMCITLQDPGT